MNKKTYIFIILILISVISKSQVNENGDFEIPDLSTGIRLLEGWKYAPEDSLKYAEPNYDDSNWQQFRKEEELFDFFEKEFNGFGWFRLRLIVPDSLIDETVYIYYIITGAYELYTNGKILEKRGKPSKIKEEEIPVHVEYKPVFFGLNSDTLVISMRYSQQNRIILGNAEPFQIGIDLVKNLSLLENEVRTSLYFMGGILGILFALAVVHLLLFIYYPKQKENIFYTLFVLSLALVVVQLIINHTSTLFFFKRFDEAIASALFFILFVFMQRSLYELFRLNIKIFRYLIIISIAVFIIALILLQTIGFALLILLAVLFVDIFRAIVISLKKKLYGYKHVIIGSLILIFGLIYQISSVTFGFSIQNMFLAYLVFSLFILAIPVSMSVLLARKYASTNIYLSKQLKKVKLLSAKTLKQEQEKKRILENQNIKLEQQVQDRTTKLVKQKEEIEEQNKHINDSITYASRIQKAILGNPDDIITKFKDAFILLKPHSIVSGDFYWFSEITNTDLGDLQIIIAADCTGHGVPGAFMTVMGHDFLEEIVNKQNILLPNEILLELDKRVVLNLKKQSSANQVNDGMDIAVLVYAKNTRDVYFSGANNPLFFVRNNELQKIRGSRFAIGGLGKEMEKNFELHKIQIERNDKFYIFSDGFHDQFGGERNRKYMIKPFKELLLKNSHLSMSNQKQFIENEFYQWKSNREQTDDILIIGIEF